MLLRPARLVPCQGAKTGEPGSSDQLTTGESHEQPQYQFVVGEKRKPSVVNATESATSEARLVPQAL